MTALKAPNCIPCEIGIRRLQKLQCAILEISTPNVASRQTRAWY